MTLQVMAELVRQGADSGRFRSLVFNRIGDGMAPDYLTIDRWVRGHFRYRPEAREVVRTPDFMLNTLEETGYVEGDCDCISVFYATVLRVLGYRVRFVAIRYSDPFDFQHVFGEFFNGSRWLRFDPTVEPGVVHVELERMVENL